jgi:hypothetical protein
MDEVSREGGLRRRGPTGGFAKGMPLKASFFKRLAPTTEPWEKVTVGAALFSTTFVGGSGGAAIACPRRAAVTKVAMPFMVLVRALGKGNDNGCEGGAGEGRGFEVAWSSLAGLV